jgi:hypothetical protein
MQIRVRQSGGFAGLDICLGSVRLSQVPDKLVRRFEAAVEAHLRSAHRKTLAGSSDSLWYHLSIEDRSERTDITLPASATGELASVVRELVPFLTPPI